MSTTGFTDDTVEAEPADDRAEITDPLGAMACSGRRSTGSSSPSLKSTPTAAPSADPAARPWTARPS